MYENTKSSIDWKGIFLKVIIAFLIVAIAFTGIKTFTKNNSEKKQTTTQVAESNASTTFTANIDKLKEAGEKYYSENKDKLPEAGITSMVTLNELIKAGVITSLTDADGKTCDGESSYVTAVKSDNKYTIKANLVCGESYSYVTAYLGENDSEKTENTTNTSNETYTQTSSTKTTNTKNTNTCGTGCAINVTTKTDVDYNVSINSGKTNTNNNNSNNNVSKKTYKVTFDRNGGSCYYNSKYVNSGETVNNPGSCSKNGYSFIGWYLDGREYNFNTPVTRDITLIAMYDRDIYSNSNNNRNNSYTHISTGTVTTEVYSMAWDRYNINTLSVEHVLSIENALEEIENEDGIDRDDVTKIRISSIRYSAPIDTAYDARLYRNLHSQTFLYSAEARVGESVNNEDASLGKLNNVNFPDYDEDYKSISSAESKGFDVTWTANRQRSCTTPFPVDLGYGIVNNQCNFGIIYKVTWQYQYEY